MDGPLKPRACTVGCKEEPSDPHFPIEQEEVKERQRVAKSHQIRTPTISARHPSRWTSAVQIQSGA